MRSRHFVESNKFHLPALLAFRLTAVPRCYPRCVGRGYLTFGDIEGKLDVLCVECTKVRLHNRCDLVCPDLPRVL